MDDTVNKNFIKKEKVEEKRNYTPKEIAEKAMKIASDICIYTNSNFTIEKL